MRIRAFVIAGALAAFSTAFPQSAKADDYDFNYGYAKGSLATLCTLHLTGFITADEVGEISMGFMEKHGDESKDKALEAAFESVNKTTKFGPCPIRRP